MNMRLLSPVRTFRCLQRGVSIAVCLAIVSFACAQPAPRELPTSDPPTQIPNAFSPHASGEAPVTPFVEDQKLNPTPKQTSDPNHSPNLPVESDLDRDLNSDLESEPATNGNPAQPTDSATSADQADSATSGEEGPLPAAPEILIVDPDLLAELAPAPVPPDLAQAPSTSVDPFAPSPTSPPGDAPGSSIATTPMEGPTNSTIDTVPMPKAPLFDPIGTEIPPNGNVPHALQDRYDAVPAQVAPAPFPASDVLPASSHTPIAPEPSPPQSTEDPPARIDEALSTPSSTPPQPGEYAPLVHGDAFPQQIEPANTQPPSQPAPLAEGIPSLGDWAEPSRFEATIRTVGLLTIISLAPAILLMTTSFVRISVVLGLLRQAIGTQMLPSNQIVTALSMFLTALVMMPVWQQVYDQSIKPYSQQESAMSAEQAWQAGVQPLRTFMSRQIELAGNSKDVLLFYSYLPDASQPPETYEEVPLQVLLPAYMISELKVAFLIGFQLFLPFLILDLVVSSVTVSMGMMMLPPATVALPLKLLLFVLVDGWHLVIGMLLQSFGGFS